MGVLGSNCFLNGLVVVLVVGGVGAAFSGLCQKHPENAAPPTTTTTTTTKPFKKQLEPKPPTPANSEQKTDSQFLDTHRNQ
jgi:hypothetical protein